MRPAEQHKPDEIVIALASGQYIGTRLALTGDPRFSYSTTTTAWVDELPEV